MMLLSKQMRSSLDGVDYRGLEVMMLPERQDPSLDPDLCTVGKGSHRVARGPGRTDEGSASFAPVPKTIHVATGQAVNARK